MNKNQDISQLFKRMATLLEIRGDNFFKIKSYRQAADQISSLTEPIEVLNQDNRLSDVSGLGSTLVAKIKEFLETETLESYEKLTSEIPESLLDLVAIPSLGPKKVFQIYQKLNISTVEGLQQAIEEKSLFELQGFREKTVQKISDGIDLVDRHQKISAQFLAETEEKDSSSSQTISLDDIQGEFHVHSTWSDGKHTIDEMASRAQDLGYEYLFISDHSQSLVVANGLTPVQMLEKKREIEALNHTEEFADFQILMGSEVDILKDGSMDYSNNLLKECDVVVAAVHTSMTNMNKKEMTQRIMKAIQNPHVNILAHPTGVHLGKRDPFEIDFDEICRCAVDHNVFLEINSSPYRLDLHAENVRIAKKHGAKFVINTDAHNIWSLDEIRYGIKIAQTAGLEAEDVLNSYDLDTVLDLLKK